MRFWIPNQQITSDALPTDATAVADPSQLQLSSSQPLPRAFLPPPFATAPPPGAAAPPKPGGGAAAAAPGQPPSPVQLSHFHSAAGLEAPGDGIESWLLKLLLVAEIAEGAPKNLQFRGNRKSEVAKPKPATAPWDSTGTRPPLGSYR